MKATEIDRTTLWNRYDNNKTIRLLQLELPVPVRLLVSALAMAVLVFVVSVFNLPNPNMILISGLVICSALFGIPGGIVSSLAMIGYTLYFFSSDHSFVAFTHENGMKVLVTIIGVTIVGVFVCALKSAQNRALGDACALAGLLKEDNELLEQASSVDALTGLRNRFSLRRDYPRYTDQGKSLHTMMVDLDDFKEINDSLGHEKGDEALTDVGDVLLDVFGPQHTYRYGGDEFLIIVSEWTDTVFCAACETMRNKLESISLVGTDKPVLFSAGYVSGTPHYQSDLRYMIRQADDNLYHAKRNGKDQVVGTPYERSVAEKLVGDRAAVRYGEHA